MSRHNGSVAHTTCAFGHGHAQGHRLKNLNCKLIKELKSYQSANRLLLSGTPLQVGKHKRTGRCVKDFAYHLGSRQNDLSELWSLLNFLLPSVSRSFETFVATD